MSPDLTRALHDAVDTGPDDHPFDVSSLTSRIRRRRTVRAGVRGGVAVGAAGAVALGAVQLGARQPGSVLPAARAGAEPAACGSDIGSLAAAPDSSVGFSGRGTYEEEPIAARRGGRLGTFAVHPVTLGVVVPATAADLGLPSDRSLLEVQLEALTQNLVAAEAGGDGTPQTDPKHIEVLREQIGVLRVRLEESATQITPAREPLDLQALVTSGTTVVSTSALDADATWSVLYGSSAVHTLALDLLTCATPDSPGGAPLPAGTYSVYLTYRPGPDDAAVVVGPASLAVSDPTPVAGLPSDFPVGLEILGDRVVTARQDEPTGRWVVVTARDGDDNVAAAAAMLGLGHHETSDAIRGVGDERVAEGTFIGEVGDWSVRIASSTTDDGEPTIVYTLTPLRR